MCIEQDKTASINTDVFSLELTNDGVSVGEDYFVFQSISFSVELPAVKDELEIEDLNQIDLLSDSNTQR